MSWWTEQFERCVKCYACRQVCPLCYCERCIADKNRPVAIATSATSAGQFRLARHTGAPPGGPLRRMRRMHARLPGGNSAGAAQHDLGARWEETFGYRAGMDPKSLSR